jgi:hypothetical protein
VPVPRLLHPVPVVVEQIDRQATAYDDDAREAVQVVARKVTFTMSGQVKWISDMTLEAAKEGAIERASGYVLFSLAELRAVDKMIVRGDRFASIGGRACNVFVERTEPTAHYPDLGGPGLLKAHFSSR